MIINKYYCKLDKYIIFSRLRKKTAKENLKNIGSIKKLSPVVSKTKQFACIFQTKIYGPVSRR